MFTFATRFPSVFMKLNCALYGKFKINFPFRRKSKQTNSFVSASRCASCIGESARSAWYRHSDGWRGAPAPGPRRSPWDSLPSLRHEGSLNDSGYRSNRADSFEQRGVFDRQDSVRSEYTSDRESSRYGIVQQASIDSTDSRICYLTSSEVSLTHVQLQ
ncbi:unnamed protein product [Euphydryas editha]|uniref:Uncharacterized protein n=1 Tax=Euphydryas editha TaxID=104508 RepID=A0AAU9VAQ1_EUPED|nr:unnamed protein product [Euphydryas editha]